jgi:hypothetical protein
MSLATAMYFSERNPLKKLSYKSSKLPIPRGMDQRRLQKALLRYHDSANWPMIRQALKDMRKPHLIGDSASALVPEKDPVFNARSSHGRGNTARGKPVAKAFGDKFESAKKHNAELKTTTAKPATKPGVSRPGGLKGPAPVKGKGPIKPTRKN